MPGGICRAAWHVVDTWLKSGCIGDAVAAKRPIVLQTNLFCYSDCGTIGIPRGRLVRRAPRSWRHSDLSLIFLRVPGFYALRLNVASLPFAAIRPTVRQCNQGRHSATRCRTEENRSALSLASGLGVARAPQACTTKEADTVPITAHSTTGRPATRPARKPPQ